MNKQELKEKLDNLDIDSSCYSLDGMLYPIRYILLHTKSLWLTFSYDERGNVQGLSEFKSEDKACKSMLSLLIELDEWQKKGNKKG